MNSVEGDAPVVGEPDTVLLSLPATAPFARLARMSGATLALRRGHSLASVDDLRLAIDEALILVLGHRDHVGTIELRFDLLPTSISIEMFPDYETGPPQITSDDLERFGELAGPLVSEFDIDTETGRLRMLKRQT